MEAAGLAVAVFVAYVIIGWIALSVARVPFKSVQGPGRGIGGVILWPYTLVQSLARRRTAAPDGTRGWGERQNPR